MLHDDYERHLRLSDTDVAGPQSLSNRTGWEKDWGCLVGGVIGVAVVGLCLQRLSVCVGASV